MLLRPGPWVSVRLTRLATGRFRFSQRPNDESEKEKEGCRYFHPRAVFDPARSHKCPISTTDDEYDLLFFPFLSCV